MFARFMAAAVAVVALPLAAHAADLPISVVAAQSFYGEAVAAIGGDRVAVESVLVGAEADPHDFEPPPSVARAVADAGIVVMNGLDYDHWMEDLLAASPRKGRVVIEVAEVIGAGEGTNPHLWYDPETMPALAAAIAGALAAADPEGAPEYRARLDAYTASLAPLGAKVAAIRQGHGGTAVIASEPVFGLMADALGLDMLGEDFQRAIMNETEPSARAIAGVEDDIRSGRAKVLFYNSQIADPLTERLLALAAEAGLPVVGVTESPPPGKSYLGWMLDQLEATEKALSAPAS